MKTTTARQCEHCRERPADQRLFTTFMRCGEGDATKRKSELCDRCRQHAMLILHRIGMVVSFEGDDQLYWDAHITFSENATRSRARRARQREDLLLQLQLDSPETRARANEPTEPERFSILHELKAEGLIESTVDRGREFWPEDACRLTTTGVDAAERIRAHRSAETDGLPIDEWNPLYVPDQGTETEFREYADQHAASPDGKQYDASRELMLRRTENAPARPNEATHPLFDKEMWTEHAARPIGYFVFENVPAIAFDIDDAGIIAEYYELIRAAGGTDIRWTLMRPTPGNPMHENESAATVVRADAPGRAAIAFVSTFRPPGARPGIRKLRERAQHEQENMWKEP